MEINHALWRLRQARLSQDRTMTPTLLAHDFCTQSFTRQRLESGGMRLQHAVHAQECAA
jgi:hypothetical protein